MSEESYGRLMVCTSGPNCRFVDLTLWIGLQCAELTHPQVFGLSKGLTD
jgi:hypothetical protein